VCALLCRLCGELVGHSLFFKLCRYSVIVSQYIDVVWTETPAYFPHVGTPSWGGPASGFSALQYKLGRAAGNFSKPHWGIVTLTGCGLAPSGGTPQTLTAMLGAAEAAANGGVAALLYGDSLDNNDGSDTHVRARRSSHAHGSTNSKSRGRIRDDKSGGVHRNSESDAEGESGVGGKNWPADEPNTRNRSSTTVADNAAPAATAAADPCLPSAQAWARFADTHRHFFSRDRQKQADVAIL
jgi:hypothetical protein